MWDGQRGEKICQQLRRPATGEEAARAGWGCSGALPEVAKATRTSLTARARTRPIDVDASCFRWPDDIASCACGESTRDPTYVRRPVRNTSTIINRRTWSRMQKARMGARGGGAASPALPRASDDRSWKLFASEDVAGSKRHARRLGSDAHGSDYCRCGRPTGLEQKRRWGIAVPAQRRYARRVGLCRADVPRRYARGKRARADGLYIDRARVWNAGGGGGNRRPSYLCPIFRRVAIRVLPAPLVIASCAPYGGEDDKWQTIESAGIADGRQNALSCSFRFRGPRWYASAAIRRRGAPEEKSKNRRKAATAVGARRSTRREAIARSGRNAAETIRQRRPARSTGERAVRPHDVRVAACSVGLNVGKATGRCFSAESRKAHRCRRGSHQYASIHVLHRSVIRITPRSLPPAWLAHRPA